MASKKTPKRPAPKKSAPKQSARPTKSAAPSRAAANGDSRPDPIRESLSGLRDRPAFR
jgi:hypothetical protein